MVSKKSTASSTTSKTSTTQTSSKTSGGNSVNYIMSIMSFIAVCFCGIALFLAMILAKFGISASFCGALQKVANIIGWSVLCLFSFRYIKRRRIIWIWVVWVVAIVMIATGIIFA